MRPVNAANGRSAISGSVGFLSSHYNDFQTLNPLTLAPINLSGLDLIFNPKFTGSVNMSYTIPSSFGDVVASVNFRHISRYFTAITPDPSNTDPNAPTLDALLGRTPQLNQLDLSLAVHPEFGRVKTKINGFVRNVLDRRGLSSATIVPGLFESGQAREPRTYGCAITYTLRGDPGINREFRGLRLAMNVARYYLRHDGPMATGPFEVGAFVRSTPAVPRPDVQLYMGGFTFARSYEENRPVPPGAVEAEPGATIYGQLLRLTSEGNIRITSADPRALPGIAPNWLQTPEDQASAIAMARYMRNYMRQPAIARYIAGETFPGISYQSDEALLEIFRRVSTCGTHATSTCRMGSDNRAVVDPDLRVNGVSGLRVVDCSVMPSLVSGNTNAPAMALGWAAAERIRNSPIDAAAGRPA